MELSKTTFNKVVILATALVILTSLSTSIAFADTPGKTTAAASGTIDTSQPNSMSMGSQTSDPTVRYSQDSDITISSELSSFTTSAEVTALGNGSARVTGVVSGEVPQYAFPREYPVTLTLSESGESGVTELTRKKLVLDPRDSESYNDYGSNREVSQTVDFTVKFEQDDAQNRDIVLTAVEETSGVTSQWEQSVLVTGESTQQQVEASGTVVNQQTSTGRTEYTVVSSYRASQTGAEAGYQEETTLPLSGDSLGDVDAFTNMQQVNGKPAVFSGSENGLRVSTRTSGIPTGELHNLVIAYRSLDNQPLTVTPIDADGEAVGVAPRDRFVLPGDPSTVDSCTGGESYDVCVFTLTQPTTEYINSGGELFLEYTADEKIQAEMYCQTTVTGLVSPGDDICGLSEDTATVDFDSGRISSLEAKSDRTDGFVSSRFTVKRNSQYTSRTTLYNGGNQQFEGTLYLLTARETRQTTSHTDVANVPDTGSPTPRSCRDVLGQRQNPESGLYEIDPDGDEDQYGTMTVYCEMDKNNDGDLSDGGWTRLSSSFAQNSLGAGNPTVVRGTAETGDKFGSPYSVDTKESHTARYDIPVPFGYSEFYIGDFTIQSASYLTGTEGTSEISGELTSWEQSRSDVGFGTPDRVGPTTSYGDFSEGQQQLGNYGVLSYPGGNTSYSIGDTSDTLRIQWGQQGTDSEGIVWEGGSVYVRGEESRAADVSPYSISRTLSLPTEYSPVESEITLSGVSLNGRTVDVRVKSETGESHTYTLTESDVEGDVANIPLGGEFTSESSSYTVKITTRSGAVPRPEIETLKLSGVSGFSTDSALRTQDVSIDRNSEKEVSLNGINALSQATTTNLYAVVCDTGQECTIENSLDYQSIQMDVVSEQRENPPDDGNNEGDDGQTGVGGGDDTAPAIDTGGVYQSFVPITGRETVQNGYERKTVVNEPYGDNWEVVRTLAPVEKQRETVVLEGIPENALTQRENQLEQTARSRLSDPPGENGWTRVSRQETDTNAVLTNRQTKISTTRPNESWTKVSQTSLKQKPVGDVRWINVSQVQLGDRSSTDETILSLEDSSTNYRLITRQDSSGFERYVTREIEAGSVTRTQLTDPDKCLRCLPFETREEAVDRIPDINSKEKLGRDVNRWRPVSTGESLQILDGIKSMYRDSGGQGYIRYGNVSDSPSDLYVTPEYAEREPTVWQKTIAQTQVKAREVEYEKKYKWEYNEYKVRFTYETDTGGEPVKQWRTPAYTENIEYGEDIVWIDLSGSEDKSDLGVQASGIDRFKIESEETSEWLQWNSKQLEESPKTRSCSTDDATVEEEQDGDIVIQRCQTSENSNLLRVGVITTEPGEKTVSVTMEDSAGNAQRQNLEVVTKSGDGITTSVSPDVRVQSSPTKVDYKYGKINIRTKIVPQNVNTTSLFEEWQLSVTPAGSYKNIKSCPSNYRTTITEETISADTTSEVIKQSVICDNTPLESLDTNTAPSEFVLRTGSGENTDYNSYPAGSVREECFGNSITRDNSQQTSCDVSVFTDSGEEVVTVKFKNENGDYIQVPRSTAGKVRQCPYGYERETTLLDGEQAVKCKLTTGDSFELRTREITREYQPVSSELIDSCPDGYQRNGPNTCAAEEETNGPDSISYSTEEADSVAAGSVRACSDVSGDNSTIETDTDGDFVPVGVCPDSSVQLFNQDVTDWVYNEPPEDIEIDSSDASKVIWQGKSIAPTGEFVTVSINPRDNDAIQTGFQEFTFVLSPKDGSTESRTFETVKLCETGESQQVPKQSAEPGECIGIDSDYDGVFDVRYSADSQTTQGDIEIEQGSSSSTTLSEDELVKLNDACPYDPEYPRQPQELRSKLLRGESVNIANYYYSVDNPCGVDEEQALDDSALTSQQEIFNNDNSNLQNLKLTQDGVLRIGKPNRASADENDFVVSYYPLDGNVNVDGEVGDISVGGDNNNYPRKNTVTDVVGGIDGNLWFTTRCELERDSGRYTLMTTVSKIEENPCPEDEKGAIRTIPELDNSTIGYSDGISPDGANRMNYLYYKPVGGFDEDKLNNVETIGPSDVKGADGVFGGSAYRFTGDNWIEFSSPEPSEERPNEQYSTRLAEKLNDGTASYSVSFYYKPDDVGYPGYPENTLFAISKGEYERYGEGAFSPVRDVDNVELHHMVTEYQEVNDISREASADDVLNESGSGTIFNSSTKSAALDYLPSEKGVAWPNYKHYSQPALVEKKEGANTFFAKTRSGTGALTGESEWQHVTFVRSTQLGENSVYGIEGTYLYVNGQIQAVFDKNDKWNWGCSGTCLLPSSDVSYAGLNERYRYPDGADSDGPGQSPEKFAPKDAEVVSRYNTYGELRQTATSSNSPSCPYDCHRPDSSFDNIIESTNTPALGDVLKHSRITVGAQWGVKKESPQFRTGVSNREWRIEKTFEGTIDEIRFYDKALTSDEVNNQFRKSGTYRGNKRQVQNDAVISNNANVEIIREGKDSGINIPEGTQVRIKIIPCTASGCEEDEAISQTVENRNEIWSGQNPGEFSGLSQPYTHYRPVVELKTSTLSKSPELEFNYLDVQINLEAQEGSCKEILTRYNGLIGSSGMYEVDGENTHCDMSFAGGGWTEFWQFDECGKAPVEVHNRNGESVVYGLGNSGSYYIEDCFDGVDYQSKEDAELMVRVETKGGEVRKAAYDISATPTNAETPLSGSVYETLTTFNSFEADRTTFEGCVVPYTTSTGSEFTRDCVDTVESKQNFVLTSSESDYDIVNYQYRDGIVSALGVQKSDISSVSMYYRNGGVGQTGLPSDGSSPVQNNQPRILSTEGDISDGTISLSAEATDKDVKDKNRLEYKWEVTAPSGLSETYTGSNVEESVDETGTYYATLTVTDTDGATDTETVQLISTGSADIQDISAPGLPTYNQFESVTFNADVDKPANVNLVYEWTINGDRIVTTRPSVQKYVRNGQDVQVELTVQSPDERYQDTYSETFSNDGGSDGYREVCYIFGGRKTCFQAPLF